MLVTAVGVKGNGALESSSFRHSGDPGGCLGLRKMSKDAASWGVFTYSQGRMGSLALNPQTWVCRRMDRT